MNTNNPSGEENQISPEALSYEQALTELEEIVTALEGDERSLDEAMALFARGQALVQRCAALLDQAELKIQQVSGEKLVPFDPGA